MVTSLYRDSFGVEVFSEGLEGVERICLSLQGRETKDHERTRRACLQDGTPVGGPTNDGVGRRRERGVDECDLTLTDLSLVVQIQGKRKGRHGPSHGRGSPERPIKSSKLYNKQGLLP